MKRRSQPTSARSIFPIADTPLLLRFHRWAGLAIALVVLCVGFTGALTTWQQEIDAWLNPDLLRVEPAAGATQSLDHLVEAAAATRPGLEVVGVRLPQSSGDSIEVSVSPRSAQVFKGWYVYVDPHHARVLGSRPFDPDPWSRRGIVARVNRDLHRSTGLLTAVFVGLVLATGIVLNLSPQTAAIVQRFSPLTSEPVLPARPVKKNQAASGWQSAVAAARVAQPGSAPFAIYRDARRDFYVVRMREPGAIHRRGQTRVYVDASDAAVLAVWNPGSGSAGDRFMSWQNPLHSGYAFGGTGRVIVFLSGLAAVLFVATGVPLWYARRRARSRR